ncbi:MAG: hypothetical protein FWH18_00080 [Marinilabiliaceae bacterium]|nr:hypothetical protein [Marinilabiliaceae bacterium]
MTYRFKIISDEEKDFVFEMLIDSNALFSDFNDFIQKQLDFDKKEMTSFFLTDIDWKKEVEITLFDMSDGETEQLVMDRIPLIEMVNIRHQRLVYMFDMFNDRYLYIELIDINPTKIKNPRCVRLEGTIPSQFLGDFDKEFDKLLEDDKLENYIEETLVEDFDDIIDEMGQDDDYDGSASYDDYY